MKFAQQDPLDLNDAYAAAPDGNSPATESPWRLYIEFIAFAFQTVLESLFTKLVTLWRQPVLRALILFVCGSAVVWGISWIDKPMTSSGVPTAAESAQDRHSSPDVMAEEAVLVAATTPVETQGEKRAVETPIVAESANAGAIDFAPVPFTIEGELLEVAPITFSVADHVPGRKYQINFGNGIKREMGTSLTYTYPKKGTFLVVLVAQDGHEVRSSDQIIEIKAPTLFVAEADDKSHTSQATPDTPAHGIERGSIPPADQVEKPAENENPEASTRSQGPPQSGDPE